MKVAAPGVVPQVIEHTPKSIAAQALQQPQTVPVVAPSANTVTGSTSGVQVVNSNQATATSNAAGAGATVTTVTVTPEQLAALVGSTEVKTGLLDHIDYPAAKAALNGAIDKAPQIVKNALKKSSFLDVSKEEFHALAKIFLEQVFANENSKKALEPVLDHGLSLIYNGIKVIQSFANIGDKLKNIPLLGNLFAGNSVDAVKAPAAQSTVQTEEPKAAERSAPSFLESLPLIGGFFKKSEPTPVAA